MNATEGENRGKHACVSPIEVLDFCRFNQSPDKAFRYDFAGVHPRFDILIHGLVDLNNGSVQLFPSGSSSGRDPLQRCDEVDWVGKWPCNFN